MAKKSQRDLVEPWKEADRVPWETQLAQIRWSYIPPAKWYRMASGGRTASDALLVLVDAKESKKSPTPEMLTLTAEVPEDVWDLLRRRFSGIWRIEEIATKLELPSWDRIEELNNDDIYASALARMPGADTESDEFMEVLREEEAEVFRVWESGVHGALSFAIDDVGLAWSGTYEITFLVPKGKNGWESVGTTIASAMDPDHVLNFGVAEFLRRNHASTWRQYVIGEIGNVLEAADRRRVRSTYDNAFR